MVTYDKMNHHLHPNHKLKLERRGTPYRCDGCKERGFYSRYTCERESCSFHLHIHCADPRPYLSHPFFPKCRFRFLESGEPDRICDACRTDVKGFVYHCDVCGNDLHPCCANLERQFEDGELKLVLKKKISSKCDKCGMKKVDERSTWGYVSACETYSLHIWCVKELMMENWVKLGGFGDGDGYSSGGEISRNSDGEGSSEEGDSDESDSRKIVKRTRMLQLVIGKKKGAATGKLSKFRRTVQIAIPFVIAAILGDPTAMVAGLIANLMSH